MMSEQAVVIEPAIKNIGDFEVRRLLPAAQQRSVGPFVFWDHFGPVTLPAGRNMDVRPHPHIGLATVTWLFEGEIMHRDSLGVTQSITPGGVNWMTAGKGIVHSERTPDERRGKANSIHGLQIWLGLPNEAEDVEPEFHHHAAETLPTVELNGISFDLIAGTALGVESPVRIFSPLFYLAAEMHPGQSFDWPRQYSEQAIYVVEGSVQIDGETVPTHHMGMLPDADSAQISSPDGARIALFGGEPIGKRYLWWNFVATSPERIRAAAETWGEGGFDRVPGDEEFIPLPEDRPLP
jgi:redox-sensitive bicupin YhaK (pirin superfamily)